jgi:hypothetical protein
MNQSVIAARSAVIGPRPLGNHADVLGKHFTNAKSRPDSARLGSAKVWASQPSGLIASEKEATTHAVQSLSAIYLERE